MFRSDVEVARHNKSGSAAQKRQRVEKRTSSVSNFDVGMKKRTSSVSNVDVGVLLFCCRLKKATCNAASRTPQWTWGSL